MKLLSSDQLKIQKNSFTIPKETLELLWITNENPSRHAIGMDIKITLNLDSNDFIKILHNTCDPSTIFTLLPIEKPKENETIQKLDYYPAYLKLTPKQRWIYLNWLQDTASEIDIGYVFLYYYGLERRLLIGKFEKAVSEILKLRKHNKNSSFLNYSKYAIVYSYIYHKKFDYLVEKLSELDLNSSDNIYLHIKDKLGQDLTPEDIVDMSRQVGFRKETYIKKHRQHFLEKLREILIEKYSKPVFPFVDKCPFEKLPKEQEIIFANISFPEKIRSPKLQNYFLYKPFLSKIYNLLLKTHEETKTYLKKH